MSDHLLGTSEVATLAGVTKQAVSNWSARHPSFPAPVVILSSGPVYRRSDVLRWLERNGYKVTA